ncbi:transposase, partial [Pseudomonas aeruginosa]|uniref:transposase n=1 Tax=Pseudomonas aeruginosa TaxID=287 RepID=UPI00211B035D
FTQEADDLFFGKALLHVQSPGQVGLDSNSPCYSKPGGRRQLFADEHHLEVDCTWSMYQRVVSAYNEPDRKRGKKLMEEVINIITASDLPKALIEVKGLGETLKKYAESILAYFDRPGTSNGPTEAINGRLEHLRGTALGFRNLTNYIARCLLKSGGFRNQLHP